jgi:hypothetical protein
MDNINIVERSLPLVIPIIWISICTAAFFMGHIAHWLAYLLSIAPCGLWVCYKAYQLGNNQSH